MSEYINNNFCYFDSLSESAKNKYPSELILDNPSLEAVLIRLLVGNLQIRNLQTLRVVKQSTDFSLLPFSVTRIGLTRKLNSVFDTNIINKEANELCNKYLRRNRRNTYIHNQMLNEMTLYFFENSNSAIAGFVHLYRCLELMSYSFPMIYASVSRDYRGSYESLKQFLKGESTTELKFFRLFIAEIFNDTSILSFPFEIILPSTGIEAFISELDSVIDKEVLYNLENTTFTISFEYMISLFIYVRNGYLHFLIGQKKPNFIASSFDMNDFLSALNPHFLNWLTIIFCKIVQHGFDSLAE